jgi:ribose 5-phosphate isomerase B
MTIALASDHRGFKVKAVLADMLKAKGYEVLDFGTHCQDSCDYPDYIYPAAKAVQTGRVERAIVICYTGIGSSIVANKVKGVRASLVFNIASARLTRQHNDSNVLVLPSSLFKIEYAKKVVMTWLKAEFEGGRHTRRVQKIKEIEEKES